MVIANVYLFCSIFVFGYLILMYYKMKPQQPNGIIGSLVYDILGPLVIMLYSLLWIVSIPITFLWTKK